MRPPNGEGPGLQVPGLPNRIASTTLQDQHQSLDKDTAQADLWSYQAEFTDAARKAGQGRAADGSPDYCRNVEEWIYNLPAGYEFTADDIRSSFGASNASGSVINAAAKRRVIEHIGWAKSRAISRHGSDIKVWRRT